MTFRPACSALLLASLAACGAPLQPEEVVGTYHLVRFANTTPPGAAVTRNGCTTSILAGRLTLGNDGKLRIELDETIDCVDDDQPPSPVGRLYFADYQLDGRTLRINLHGDVSVPTTGSVQGSTIIVQMPDDAMSPLVFTPDTTS